MLGVGDPNVGPGNCFGVLWALQCWQCLIVQMWQERALATMPSWMTGIKLYSSCAKESPRGRTEDKQAGPSKLFLGSKTM